jgi:hypothetical protein
VTLLDVGMAVIVTMVIRAVVMPPVKPGQRDRVFGMATHPSVLTLPTGIVCATVAPGAGAGAGVESDRLRMTGRRLPGGGIEPGKGPAPTSFAPAELVRSASAGVAAMSTIAGRSARADKERRGTLPGWLLVAHEPEPGIQASRASSANRSRCTGCGGDTITVSSR